MLHSKEAACAAVALAFFSVTNPASAQSGAGPLAGSWIQRSSGPELAVVPQVRLVPGSGTYLTPTLQHRTSSVQVDRAMSLEVRPDGSFRWLIEKSRVSASSSATCRVLTREEKLGRLAIAGDQVTFAIAGGTQSSQNSCDASQATSGPMRSGQETYQVGVSGGRLRIVGSGGVDWSFSRR
jgi:hypothetical protein